MDRRKNVVFAASSQKMEPIAKAIGSVGTSCRLFDRNDLFGVAWILDLPDISVLLVQ